MTTKNRLCKLCQEPFSGREDKVFCSVICKSTYNHKLKRVTNAATIKIDSILHRNRSILLEIIGKAVQQVKVPRERLDNKKFNYHYITQYHMNSQNKMVNYVYDFSWMIFSDQEILIKRIKR